jgi:prepilin-type N-terminal cleavage/methylation domain-containing protein/prepilin-type processing-associated H-X9-DG protein
MHPVVHRTAVPSEGRSKSAFTLIELLVVIAIIAILAAILFPVFAQARSKARQVAGLSNAKQMGTAIMLYIQDYDEVFPRAGWDCLAGFEATNACGTTNWQNVTWPYYKNTGIVASPGDASNSTLSGIAEAPDGQFSLLYNDLLAHSVATASDGTGDWLNQQDQKAVGLSQAAVNAPADCVLFAEGSGGWAKGGYPGWNNPVPSGATPPTAIDDTMSKWYREQTISGGQTFLLSGKSYGSWGQVIAGAGFYNEGGNVGFADGHAKFVKYKDANGEPTLRCTLPWRRHLDPQQRGADRSTCGTVGAKQLLGDWD